MCAVMEDGFSILRKVGVGLNTSSTLLIVHKFMNEQEVTQPSIVNFMCPKCRLTWMCKNGNERFYFCYACSFILFDRQVEELRLKGEV
ncbi:MAG: hypothetical protein ACREBR_05450 [bacterium]